MFLVTTAIEEFWDFNKRLLLLGPWCLANKENRKLLEEKDYSVVPSPWKPGLKIKDVADYCYKIYDKLIPKLSEKLNSIHQVSYPLRYWRILLGPWLLPFIGVFYDRYRRIEDALKVFPGFYTYVLPLRDCRLLSYDAYDCLDYNINDDYYNLKLFSLIAYDLCPDSIVVKEYKKESIANPYTARYSWKRKLFNRLLGPVDSFFKPPIILSDMYHLTFSDMVFLKLKGGFKIFRFIDFEPMQKTFLKRNYSQEMRDTIKIEGANDRLESLLYEILPSAIPMSYVENYKFYKSSITNINNITYVKIVGSAIGWYYNERFKFFAAEAILNGASLIEFQHGAGYGMLSSVPSEDTALEKDIFYTWGWNRDTNNKIRPLPSPHLSRLKDTHLPKLNNILFVGTGMPRYLYRFHAQPLPEDMPKYFEDKKIFFQGLTDRIKSKILYRPYMTGYGWEELDIVKKIYPNVKFVVKSKLVKWMQKVKLVVIDHPSTPLIEALTINVPCIFFWDYEMYLMRPETEKYFNLLRDAGILFKDPLNAAKKVNEIFNDPMGWWQKDTVQKAHLEFCKEYAYARKDWAKIWTQELTGLRNKA